MFAFIRKITCRIACLCFVLLRFKIKDNCVWICFVSFPWKFVTQPGTGFLVFPSFDQVVTQVLDFITASQSFQIGNFSVVSSPFMSVRITLVLCSGFGNTGYNHASGSHETGRQFWLL